MSHVQVKRIYEDHAPDVAADDGTRVLVDRLWPRGISKESAALDEWCRDVAPTTELRKWYSHDPEKFDEFADRYRTELGEGDQAAALDHLAGLASSGTLTLLTATKDPSISAAEVLRRLLVARDQRLDD